LQAANALEYSLNFVTRKTYLRNKLKTNNPPRGVLEYRDTDRGNVSLPPSPPLSLSLSLFGWSTIFRDCSQLAVSLMDVSRKITALWLLCNYQAIATAQTDKRYRRIHNSLQPSTRQCPRNVGRATGKIETSSILDACGVPKPFTPAKCRRHSSVALAFTSLSLSLSLISSFL